MTKMRDRKTGRFVKQDLGICKEGGCFKVGYASGYCKTHYGRYQMRAYLINHPEQRQKRNRYYKRNKDKIKAQRDKIRSKINERQTRNRKSLRLEVLYRYSNGTMKCGHCGIIDKRVLTIDHINNNGAEERRKLAEGKKHKFAGSYQFYYFLRKSNYPKGYQVLCANCNLIKQKKRYA